MSDPRQRSIWQRVLGAAKQWWILHFSGFDRREAWGYGVWLFFAVIVLVPELWAAFWKDSAKWPTISSTTGSLEYDRPVLALVIVATIIICAYSAVAYPFTRTGVLPVRDLQEPVAGGIPGDPALPYRTARGGRLTRSVTPVREVAAGLYFAVALAIIAGGTAVAAAKSDITGEFAVGRTLYGLMALFWVIIPSALAWPRRFAVDIPFPTMFETVRSLERRLRIVALAVVAGLAMLLIHLVLYPWPSIIPDLKRLHVTYQCHPLKPPKKGLSKVEKDACKKLDKAQVKPTPVTP